MAPQEEVVESKSGDEVEPIEAPSLAFGEKKEGELLPRFQSNNSLHK